MSKTFIPKKWRRRKEKAMFPKDFSGPPPSGAHGPMGKPKLTLQEIERIFAELKRLKDPPLSPSPTRMPRGINADTFRRRDTFGELHEPQGTKYGAGLLQLLMGGR